MSDVKHTAEDHVTRDLMRKLAGDVSASMARTLSLVERRQMLPISVSAGASCVGIVAGILNTLEGNASGGTPDPECVLLAGLLIARTGIGGDDPIGDAYRDLEALKSAGLFKASGETP